jgi:hypothetical protein
MSEAYKGICKVRLCLPGKRQNPKDGIPIPNVFVMDATIDLGLVLEEYKRSVLQASEDHVCVTIGLLKSWIPHSTHPFYLPDEFVGRETSDCVIFKCWSPLRRS